MLRRSLAAADFGKTMSDAIQIYFDDKPIVTREGQSVAAALMAAGERCLRIDEAGNPKGVLCGIGVCWECRCSIDGATNTRACMTSVRSGMIVRRQTGV
jgi:predicted molibdopterin-dependent oxidoreductase YjgC